MGQVFTLETAVETAKLLGHPTTGEFAWWLWEMLSSNYRVPVDEAKRLYEECGYIPFSGYPLSRQGK